MDRRLTSLKTSTSYPKSKRQSSDCRSIYTSTEKKSLFRIHPLFLLLGVWYALTGELFLFLLSALVALQHECAHAFAAAKLGYKLNKIVLMPFGAVIDGDLHGISFRDEIIVALCGPLCNLLTAGVFVAIWWLTPTMYAFTDTACYSSLAIALVNFLPAYPLDGGRILKCALIHAGMKKHPNEQRAERRAEKICRVITLLFALAFLLIFTFQCVYATPNFTALAFGIFLFVGAFGNKNDRAAYGKIDFSHRDALKKGVEIKRVAVMENCSLKNALRFIGKGHYLVLEVYDRQEHHLFDLPQNMLSEWLLLSKTPYETLGSLKTAFVENKSKKA